MPIPWARSSLARSTVDVSEPLPRVSAIAMLRYRACLSQRKSSGDLEVSGWCAKTARSGSGRTRARVALHAEHDRPLPRPHLGNRAEGESTAPLRQQRVPANDDLVRVVGRALVANVVEPADCCAVAGQDAVAIGGGEQATELRLPLQALSARLAAFGLHGREAYSGFRGTCVSDNPVPAPIRPAGKANARRGKLGDVQR